MTDRPDHTPATARGKKWDDPSLDAAIRDGRSSAVMLGCGETYLGPFGIFLQAGTLQIGLLATLPQLVGAIMQWVNARTMDRFKSRRRIIVASVICQALVWIPMGLLPFFVSRSQSAVYLLIALAVLYHATAGFSLPVWNSLIGDLVPADIRGRFFGHRNRIKGIYSFFALSLAGVVLHLFARSGQTAMGFLIIFMVAALARLNSSRWLARYGDPEFILPAEHVFTFRQFLQRSPHSNFAKYVFFVAAINFAVAFSAPYFALYMLRDLKFSYLQFTAVTSVSTITQFLLFRHWGNLSDSFGNKKILNVCGWGVGFVPMLWLFSANIFYLMAIQVVGGIVWAGFSLASNNFLFDAVSPPKRARCVAYQSLVNGVTVLTGSLLGGFVAVRLPHSFDVGFWIWTPAFTLPVIFLLSGLMRLAAAAFMLRKFKEVRTVEPIRHRELIYRVSHIKPIAGATFSLFTGTSREDKSDSPPKQE
ncbi:MAG: MFS transporter [Proteobacteria bacterium]|nr:MFS transporter [Pseudomonadota bacterium]MBU1710630.1 MFS transporter [Pseudomonadota bacterium]